MFRYDRDTELTGEALKEFIALHEVEKLRYQELRNQYLTEAPIVDRPAKEENWKPDSRLVGNFGKYLIDTFNGFFNGIPMRVNHNENDINQVIHYVVD